MKRIIYYVSLLFIFIPMVTLADSASPSILGYDAVITNKNGIKVDTYDGIKEIKYNTKIHVLAEYDDSVEFNIIGDEESTFLSTSMSNIAPIKEEVLPKELKNVNNMGSVLDTTLSEYIVLSKNGIKLSKGPADVYGKYDKVIPYKTIIKATYYIDADGIGSDIWYYIDSDGYKGWLDIDSDDTAFKDTGDFLAFNDADFLDDGGNKIDTIKAESKFDEIFFNGKMWYLKYNDKYGFVKASENFDLGVRSQKGYIITLKKTNIISMNNEVRGSIPMGEKVKILYASADDNYSDNEYHYTYPIEIGDKIYYYVEYTGVKGFIDGNDVTSLGYEEKEESIDLKEEMDLYDPVMIDKYLEEGQTIYEFLDNFKKIERMPKSGTITIYKTGYLYDYVNEKGYRIKLVKYKGKIGCIIDLDNSNNNENMGNPPSKTNEPRKTQKPIINNNNSSGKKTEELITLAIFGAIIFSITALVITLLINKKSKKKESLKEIKKDVVKEETKPENDDSKKKIKTEEASKPEPKKKTKKNKE